IRDRGRCDRELISATSEVGHNQAGAGEGSFVSQLLTADTPKPEILPFLVSSAVIIVRSAGLKGNQTLTGSRVQVSCPLINCGAFCHKFGADRYFPDGFVRIKFEYLEHG